MKDECIGIEHTTSMRAKISWIIIFILVPFFAKSQKNTIYPKILLGLSKSYVIDYKKNTTLQDFLMCYNISLESFKKDKSIYKKNLYKFYNLESGIIDFLLKYKDDTLHMNHWIVTPNPCISKLPFEKMFTNSRASIVLLYNYLSFNEKYHIVPDPDFLKSKKNVNTMIAFCKANLNEKTEVLREKWKRVNH